jgi:hypothetical protein
MRDLFRLSLLVSLSCAPALVQQIDLGAPRTVTEAPALAGARATFGDGVYLAVWQDGWAGVNPTADIKGVRLRPGSLQPIEAAPIRICTAAEAQESPAVAYADGVFLVAWQDLRSGQGYDIRAALIDAKTGRVRGREIPVATQPGNQIRPAVASDGNTFLVVWQAAGDRTYGVQGARISSTGKILDTRPHRYAEAATLPAASGSSGRFLITWAPEEPRGGTSGALIDAATGEVIKALGVINSPCSEAPAIAHDDAGNFMTVSAREGYPNPWGWPGPGAVLCSRVMADGSTPEASLKYGPKLSFICLRSVPNVVDGATWGRTSKSWDSGAVGGFPGTADGLWPNGWPTVAYDGRGTYLFAWVKGTIAKDRLNLSDLTLWIRGMDAKTLAVRVADRRLSADAGAGETHPALVAGPQGEALLLSERIKNGERIRVLARRVTLQ